MYLAFGFWFEFSTFQSLLLTLKQQQLRIQYLLVQLINDRFSSVFLSHSRTNL